MIGVIADDFTGANDIGIMFAMNGYRTYVYSVYDQPSCLKNEADVVILNTNSRLDTGEIAYKKVKVATQTLKAIGCNTYFKKTCSVFRGNIGVEFDAMLDELATDFCCVILGFPKNGRVTKDGIHYVYNQLLEESAFKDDPVNPMRESNLVKILQTQTKRKVELIDYRIVSQGADIIKKQMYSLKGKCGYVIFDVTSQRDLFNIAGAVKDEIALAGSSAIGEELPKWLPKRGKGIEMGSNHNKQNISGTLIIAGSVTPQTKNQVTYAKQKGVETLTLPTELLLQEESRRLLIEKLSTTSCNAILAGKDIMIHTENEVDQVREARRMGLASGYDEKSLGRMISLTLSQIVKTIASEIKLTKLITLGGETSGVICEGLGIYGNLVLKEIAPGVPSVLTIGETELFMVPKSGSFGEDDFVIKAIEHLGTL